MRSFFLVLAVCACAAAMVNRERRAMNSEEHRVLSSTTTAKPFCAPSTPCAWGIYNKVTKEITQYVQNTFCDCSPELECQHYEVDTNNYSYTYRCRPPTENEEEDSES